MYTQFGNGTMMGGQRMMDTFGFGGLGGLGIIAFIGFMIVGAIVVGLVIWAIARKPAGSNATTPLSSASAATAEEGAIAIARTRLARGEIEPEQYTAIVNALNEHFPIPTTQG